MDKTWYMCAGCLMVVTEEHPTVLDLRGCTHDYMVCLGQDMKVVGRLRQTLAVLGQRQEASEAAFAAMRCELASARAEATAAKVQYELIPQRARVMAAYPGRA